MAYNIIAGRDTLYTHDIELAFKRYAISSIMRPPFWGYYLVSHNVSFLEIMNYEKHKTTCYAGGAISAY